MRCMKLWKPLLVILPAGLVVGLVGARLVDPRTTLAPEVNAAIQADIDRRAALGYRPPPLDSGGTLDEEIAPGGNQRPDLDWDEEVWPEDYVGGAHDHPDRLLSENPSRWSDDFYDSPDTRAGAEAAQAAALAARAVEDATRAAAEASAQTGSGTAEPAEPAPSPSPAPPREPRTADGDLPAIW